MTKPVSASLAGKLFPQGTFYGSVALTADTAATQFGRAVAIKCTVTGAVVLVLADGSTETVTVPVGLTVLPLAVRMVQSSGTTATATYSNWL